MRVLATGGTYAEARAAADGLGLGDNAHIAQMAARGDVHDLVRAAEAQPELLRDLVDAQDRARDSESEAYDAEKKATRDREALYDAERKLDALTRENARLVAENTRLHAAVA